MGTINENFDTYPFKENGNGKPGGGSPTSTQGAELKVTTLTSSDFNDSNEFSFHHNKGTLKFVNIRETVKNTFSTSSFIIPDTHTTKFDVKNKETLSIRRPLVFIRKSDEQLFIPKNLTSLPFSMSFQNVVTTPATSSDYLNSYADITIGNLRTFSGDVHKVKLFTRQQDKQNQEFEKIGEFVLQSKNTLVDESSPTADNPIGIFYSQSVIDNHWVSSSNSTTADNSLIMNAALISGSNRGADDFVEFKTKDRFELEKGEEYILSFSGYFIKGDKVQSDGSVRKSSEIEVLLSGSVVSQTEDTISIGSIGDVGDSSSELFKGNVSGSIPYLYNYVYTHKKSGAKPKAGLVFRVHAGQFHLSNIKFEAVSDQNFNPGFYKTRVPMPIATRRGQRYDFVSEFYDFNNNKAKIEAATSASVLFAGPKQVLADGEDAIFSGSAMIGQSIQMYGVNPAFLRSVGYNGFDKTLAGTGDRDGGFLLWSGSVGSAISASETYNGVGFEIVQKGANPHQNSFLQFASKYKGGTTSRFRVQTDEFLLGRSGSGTAGDAYISGSNGNLEISSSNFLVSASGDVIMQGTITATAGGTIGGFTVGSTSLSAGNVFQLSSSQNVNDPVSFISSSNFKVSAGGKVTGSNILLTGGTITSDVTVQGTFTANQILTPADAAGIGSASASIDERGNAIFRSGSIGGFRISPTTLFSNSNEFVVTGSTGQITGSKVLFTGGKIGGFNIVSDGLSSINNVFQVTGSTGQITGSNVLFTGGKIGGFTIDADEIKAGSTLILDSDTDSGQIKLGGATSVTNDDGIYMDGTGKFRVGDADGQRISFNSGLLVISSSTFMIGSKAAGKSFISSSVANGLEISSSNFHLSASGKITASAVKLSGDITAQTGNIGGFTIDSDEIKSTNLLLDSNNEKITVGSSNAVTIQGGSADNFITMGNKTGFNSTAGSGTAGIIIGMDGTNPQAEFVKSATNYFIFDDGIDIKTPSFKLDTDNLDIDSDSKKITITDEQGTPRERVRIGKVDTGADNYGLKIFDGTGAAADGTILAEFSNDQNVIAGWTISTSTISSNNLVLNSAGQISSQGYASNQQGFFLGMRPLSDGSVGAFLEVDEANIRGTLKTTVFEKETVNAVGGQLHVANATTITGSVSMSTTDTTMQVANASGFSSGEIIQLKKFNPTGFTTEYMKIHSVSLKDAGSETNFSGSLVVTRSLGTSAPQGTVSGSIGFSGSSAQSYTPGQVIVSTGKIGTGYIRLNANPNDQTTPYMDIVERTGSGVYSIDLKARLGDLSGIVDTINGQSVSGFGLYTDNAFLKGGIVATYGSIGGLNMSSTDLWAGNSSLGAGGTVMVIGDITTAPKIALGGTANSMNLNTGDGIFMSSSGEFRVGDVDGDRLIFEGGNLSVTASKFGLETSTMHISSSNGGVIAMGSTIPKGNDFTDNGIMLSGSGEFNFQLDSDNFIRRDGNELNLKSEVFGLKTSKMVISSSLNNGTIALGSTPPTSINYTANSGIYMDGNGDFLVRGDNDNFIKFDVSDKLSIAAEDFELDAGGLKLIGNSGTAANNQIRLGSATALNTGDGLFASGDGKFRVGADNGHRLEFDGTNLVVSSSDFFLGSKGSNNAYISSSGNVLEISSSKFSLNSDGTVEVEGSISITSGDLAGVTKAKISGSSDALSGSLATRQTNTEATSSTLKTDSGSLAARLKLDSNGVDVLNSSDVSIAQLTNSLRIGRDAAGQSRLEIDSSGNLSIINRQGSTDTNVIQLLANGNSSFSGSGTFGGAITATSGKIAGWDINSNRLDSTNDKVILDGNNNNGEIRLGSSPPTSATNGAGIYLGGDGTFLVGDADGHRVSFENSKLIVSSSTFFLGSKGSANSYISSSGDVLEISSSKFALKKNGDVSIEGTVTATAGDIGGWNINSNDLVGGSVRLFQEGIIQLTGNADFAGASKDALGEISGSGTIGPSFELKRKSYNANYVDVVKINTSGSYDNTDTYVNNEDKQTVSITRSGTTSEQSAVATFGATQTSWDESYYIKAKDSSNQTVAELDTSAPGTNELIDLGAANQVFELVFQNLQEAAKPQVGSPPGGSAKSLYRYRVELYQNDSNTTSGAELVGSFNISSVLTINSSFSFADLNTSSTTFFPFRRYIYVKVVGTRYDELTGDNGSGTEHSLNMSGAPFSITSYVPKTRVNAVGLQSYAGPNQEVRIGAVNEVKGDFTVNGISGGGRGNLIVSGSGTFGTLGTFSPDFQLYVEGDMAATGNITAFFSSDKRLKENIIEIGEGLSIVNQLRPVRFDWKEDIPFHTENISEYGLIAQEVEDVLPEVVGLMKGDYKGIKYDKIVPLLISSIKELTKRVEELEKDNQ